MIRSIIFDLDGTLLDRKNSLYQFVVDQFERIIKTAKKIDKECYIHRFIELDNHGYVWKDKVYQALIKEFDLPLDWNELLTDYKNRFHEYAKPFPNTFETLEKLKQLGYKIGMITNGYGDFQSRNIKALGLQSFFQVILISEIEGIRKPDPAIFIKAAKLMNLKPEECAYVGDHPINDVAASRNVGMKGIWKVDSCYQDHFRYDGLIRDLLEIELLINQWNLEGDSKKQ